MGLEIFSLGLIGFLLRGSTAFVLTAMVWLVNGKQEIATCSTRDLQCLKTSYR